MMSPTIRPMIAADIPALCRIFYDAIHEGAAPHYDAAQRTAWCPKMPDPVDWAGRLAGHRVTVAEQAGQVVGFMTLRPDGYIDLAFVAPSCAGQGIGLALLHAIEAEARACGITHLTVQASLVARPLFAKARWQLVREQVIEWDDVSLTNFAMEKWLEAR